MWWRQEELCALVVRYHTVVSPWGNQLGKTWGLARLVLWWLTTRYGSEVVTTSPTHESLDRTLWKNIRLAAKRSKIPLGIRFTSKPLTATMGEAWSAVGIATNQTERISGQHNALGLQLALIDEASGIEPEIVEGIDSLGAARIVYAGNPLRYDGPFRELYDQGCEEARQTIPDDERIVCLRVPSTDSPDAHLDHSTRGLADGGWLRRMWRKHGKDSLWCRTHIDAKFPEASSCELYPVDWLDAATCTALAELRRSIMGGPVRLACDLGEGVGADSTVIVARDDLGIREVWASNDSDLERAADQFYRMGRTWKVKEEHMSYDKMGIGRPFGNRLAGHGLHHVFPYSGGASGGKHYANLRSACAWKLRERLDPRHLEGAVRMSRQIPFHIPPGDYWTLLREDLLAMRDQTVGTKNRLETKEECIARLGRSPDRGDALIQSFVTDVLGVAA